MAYLHAFNVIHRDLKSLNVLVMENDSVKICDYGCCRIVDDDKKMTASVGTVAWMAPESNAAQCVVWCLELVHSVPFLVAMVYVLFFIFRSFALLAVFALLVTVTLSVTLR